MARSESKVKGSVLWRQVKKKNVLDFSKWDDDDAFDGQYGLDGVHVRSEALTRSNRQPNRLARWTFRLGVAVCGLIVVASVASLWRAFTVLATGWTVRLDYAAVYVFAGSIAPGAGWSAWSTGPASQDFHLWTAKWLIVGVTVRSYPAWMLLLAALIPTVLVAQAA